MSTAAEVDVFNHPNLGFLIKELGGIGRIVALSKSARLRDLPKPKELIFHIPEGTQHVALGAPGFACPGSVYEYMQRKINSPELLLLNWGPHLNAGPFRFITNHWRDTIKRIADSAQMKIDVVGYSLGGNIALASAREMPDEINDVITIAAPLQATKEQLATSTNIGAIARLLSRDQLTKLFDFLDLIDDSVLIPERERPAIKGKRISIVGALDGIIAPHSALDTDLDVRLKLGHLGAITDPIVAQLVEHFIIHGLNVPLPDHLAQEPICEDHFNAIAARTFGRSVRQTLFNVPGSMLNAATRPLLDPRRAEANADPKSNVFAITNVRAIRPNGQPGNPLSKEEACSVVSINRNGAQVQPVSAQTEASPLLARA